MTIVISAENMNGLEVSLHFGRSHSFVLVDVEEQNITCCRCSTVTPCSLHEKRK